MSDQLNQWLSAVKERLEKATPGPWRVHQPYGTEIKTVCSEIEMDDGSKVPSFDWIIGHMQVSNCPRYKEDADLIANAPTDLATAIKIIERMAKASETCNRVVNDHEYGQDTNWVRANICGITRATEAEVAKILEKR